MTQDLKFIRRSIQILSMTMLVFAIASYAPPPTRNLWPIQMPVESAYAAPVQNSRTEIETIFFPLLMRPDPFTEDSPIWAHEALPEYQEVVLFRHAFTNDLALQNPELHIFADTRYEVWIDGKWIGRGPARFSQTLREYDVYNLQTLQEGDHLVAALVQWAPNIRRSESITPFLQAHIQGNTNVGFQLSAISGPSWQTKVSDAWLPNSTPVHSMELIGPTELLDLSRLPPGWNQPGYQSDNWTPAVIKEISGFTQFSYAVLKPYPFDPIAPERHNNPRHLTEQTVNKDTIQYVPRSIPLLASEPISITVKDVGLRSPDFRVGEILPQEFHIAELSFLSSEPTIVTIETLTTSLQLGTELQIDGHYLSWHEVGNERYDVFRSSIPVTVGVHQVTFSNIPSQGLTFMISTQGLAFQNFPFEQGSHAGRRQLLSEPVSDPSAVDIITTTNGLDLEFNNLPAYVILDLGRTVHGRLTTQVSGPPGSVLDIGWSERLSTIYNRPLPFPGSLHPEWNQVDSWVLEQPQREISTIDARAGRYILISAWGDQPIHLSNIRVYEERYPAQLDGSFHSSDPLLNQIWQVGVDTLRPNMTDAYADPWRERGQWWGDTYVDSKINQVAFGDTDLIKRGIRFLGDAMQRTSSPGLAPSNYDLHMLDYTMLWVHSLAEYTQQTGDPNLAKELFSELRQFLKHLESYESTETGLLELPKANWSQTSFIDAPAWHSRYGQSTALNAMYYGTLLQAAKLAQKTGNAKKATSWNKNAQSIQDGINTYLYLPDEGRYISRILNDIPYGATPHSQAWALAYGVVPESEREQVITALIELLSNDPTSPNVETYGMFWVLQALGETGRLTEGLEVIKRYYGYMLDQGASTWWERFDANLYEWASLSHGWGGAPTWFLSSYILGVRQTDPNIWQVKPGFHSVDSAAGSLPLRDGLLQVSWEHQTCSQTYLQIIASESSSGEAIIPFIGSDLIITLNDKIIWNEQGATVPYVTGQSDGVHIILESGTHELDIQGNCSY